MFSPGWLFPPPSIVLSMLICVFFACSFSACYSVAKTFIHANSVRKIIIPIHVSSQLPKIAYAGENTPLYPKPSLVYSHSCGGWQLGLFKLVVKVCIQILIITRMLTVTLILDRYFNIVHSACPTVCC